MPNFYKSILLGLLISVLALLFVTITSDQINAQAKEMAGGKGLKVTILLFSGRPDPNYLLDDKNAIEQLKTLINTAKTNDKFEKSTVIPSILGYKGIVMDNQTKVSGIPSFVAVYKGNIEVKDGGKRFLIDEAGALEKLLLDMAIEKGVIDEKVLKRMKSGK